MPVESTSFTQSVTGTATRADNDGAKLAEDFDDFLTLLTTQLQHQDPLDPMDSGEFTNQLVAFTGVEQQIQTNQNLETLQTLTALNNVGSTVAYLGQDALIEAPFGDHETDGIQWQYAVSGDIEDITLKVMTEAGATVYETSGEAGSGIHEFNWDGYNTSGTLAEPGNYQLEIEATNADGDKVDIGIAVRDTVTAVDNTGISPLFTIGPNTVDQADILQLFLKN
jgi:flagellar basal-body rod modification protein FlgD